MPGASMSSANRVRPRDPCVTPHADASASMTAVILAGHDTVLPPDLADRGRLARHRRALYAGGGADTGRAAEHRRRLRLHARHRAADAGGHAGLSRGVAYQRAGVCRAEMV